MYPVPTQILADASFFHFFFCIARRDTSTSTQVTQHQLARLRPPLIQGGQWGDEISSCTRRGPCLSPERPRPPHHIPGLWKRSHPENDTRGVPHGTNILIQKLWWRNLPNMAPRMVSMPARAAARECSRCGFPSEHMGLTTGWRCLRKQAAVPIKSS
jgi:hypothetical protein